MFTELATAHDKTVTLGPLALGLIGMIHLQALVLDVLRRSKSGNRPCNHLINIKFLPPPAKRRLQLGARYFTATQSSSLCEQLLLLNMGQPGFRYFHLRYIHNQSSG